MNCFNNKKDQISFVTVTVLLSTSEKGRGPRTSLGPPRWYRRAIPDPERRGRVLRGVRRRALRSDAVGALCPARARHFLPVLVLGRQELNVILEKMKANFIGDIVFKAHLTYSAVVKIETLPFITKIFRNSI